MSAAMKVAVIGLDTSHTIEFTRRLQAPDCPADQKVDGAKVVACLRFSTPFYSEEGLDERQRQMEAWGVKVTTDFDESVADCEAVIISINDPAYHLEYFARCADLGKPIFLDKPMADTRESGLAIYNLAKEKQLRVVSASSLRSAPALKDACSQVPEALFATVYGALGESPAGSSIVWYGVHAFEMLQRAMGRGARTVYARRDKAGVVALVEYDDSRRGVVELTEKSYIYGGCLRTLDKAVHFTPDVASLYTEQLKEVMRFFKGGDAPLELEDTLEVMSMLDAAERSHCSGRAEAV